MAPAASFWNSRLASGRPGTRAGPLLPPAWAVERRARSRPPRFRSAPWQVRHRAARVAADDVRRAHEVERRLQVEFVLPLHPALGQVERRLVIVLLRPLVEPLERRLVGDLLAVLLVALDGAERQPQGEGGVGV